MAKLIKCKGCGSEIYKGAKICPQCGKKNKKHTGIIFICIIIIIILLIALFATKNNHKNKDQKTELLWPNSALAKLIPAPDSKYGKIILDSSDSLDITVYSFSENNYNDYVEKCKDAGFNVDYSASSYSYNASDANGNELYLFYLETNEEMNIQLTAFKENNNTSVETENDETTVDTTETESEDTQTVSDEKSKDTEKNNDSQDVDFRKWVDEYEEFMNDYCDFMEDYDATDLSALTEYTELLEKYNDFLTATEKLDESNYSVDDWKYFLDTQTRITKRLSKIQIK